MAAKLMWVRAIKGIDDPRPNEHRVLLFERDSRHPNGEAFIAGPLPVQVADTYAVTRLLKDDAIEEVSEKEVNAVQQEQQTAATDALAAERAALDKERAQLAQEREDFEKQRAALEKQTEQQPARRGRPAGSGE